MTLAPLLFWLGVAASVVGIVGIILCEHRRAVKRRRDAEDLAAANATMDSWKPRPRHAERNRFGQYRKTYGRFTPSQRL